MAKILVAEDDAAVREFVSRVLNHGGHTVTAVEDGLLAIEALNAARFDLLVTDIVMPGLDGIALALKATKEWPEMSILLMTGFAAERQRAHNLDALIHRVLTKPFSMVELQEAVAETLAEKRRGS